MQARLPAGLQRKQSASFKHGNFLVCHRLIGNSRIVLIRLKNPPTNEVEQRLRRGGDIIGLQLCAPDECIKQ